MSVVKKLVIVVRGSGRRRDDRGHLLPDAHSGTSERTEVVRQLLAVRARLSELGHSDLQLLRAAANHRQRLAATGAQRW